MVDSIFDIAKRSIVQPQPGLAGGKSPITAITVVVVAFSIWEV